MRNTIQIGLVLSAALAACSCGWGGYPSINGGNGGSAGSSNGSNGSGNGGSSLDGVGGLAGAGGGNGGSSQGGTGGMACAGSSVKGELIPLDMYIMLDKSGSMAELTGPNGDGPSKWDAVTAALDAFFTDQGSNGLGVGIQFFPINAPGVPDTCTSDNECGAVGPCVLASCDNMGTVVPCSSDADCGFGNCVPLGTCQNDAGVYCLYSAGAQCGPDAHGNDLGACNELTSSYCQQQDSCAAADYSTPAVEIATLDGAAASLSAAIAAKGPKGSTPTAPALDGAVKHAQAWAHAHPDHKVVAVMATDGLPTECAPQDVASISQIAAAGMSGVPGTLTFVIGVFGVNDVGAQQNLDQIAQAGGTTKAFFITSNQNVTMEFLDALHQIQGKTLSCEYQIPTPPDGSDLDYGKVNVKYTPSGSMTPETVFYVGKGEACDPMTGGWYYDKDPSAGQTPTEILTCPATCDKLKAVGGQVDIQIGCQTIVPEPK